MDQNEMMIISEIALPELRDKLLELYRRDKNIVIEDNQKLQFLQEVSEKHMDGWIPVSERYPDSDRYILLSFENLMIPSVGHYEESEDGGTFYLGDDQLCSQNDIFVNAWMELPEQYKE